MFRTMMDLPDMVWDAKKHGLSNKSPDDITACAPVRGFTLMIPPG